MILKIIKRKTQNPKKLTFPNIIKLTCSTCNVIIDNVIIKHKIYEGKTVCEECYYYFQECDINNNTNTCCNDGCNEDNTDNTNNTNNIDSNNFTNFDDFFMSIINKLEVEKKKY